jgi:hypothetical protein
LTSFGRKIDVLYRRLGEKGLMFALFAGFCSLHIIFALRMALPSVYPGEFDTAAWSAYFAGFGSSGDFAVGASRGWLNAAVYTPFYFLLDNPIARYRGMLALNSVIAAFVPLMAYRISASLGVPKAWQRTLIALVCGASVAAFAYTKLIWSASLSVFFVFLAFLLLAKTFGTKNRLLRFLLSVFTGAALAFAPAVSPDMWALAAAFVLTVFFARYMLRVKVLFLWGFLPSLAGFSLLQGYIGLRLTAAARGEAVASPGFGGYMSSIISFDSGFLHGLLGSLYYFAASTWGIGVLGICFAAFIFAGLRKAKPAAREEQLFVLFAFFAVTMSVFAILQSIGKDYYFMYGVFIDAVTPLVLLLALAYIFLHGLDFKKLLCSTLAFGVIAVLFLNITAPHIERRMEELTEIPVTHIQGLLPLRPGLAVDAPLDVQNAFFTASAVFCVFALLFVLVNCADRYKRHAIAFSVALTAFYVCMHSAFVYLPHERARAEQNNAAAVAISQYVYNSSDAPPTYVLDADLTPMLRFLNRNTIITKASGSEELPDNCFVVTEAARAQEFADIIILGEAEGFIFAARGERASAFAISQEEN